SSTEAETGRLLGLGVLALALALLPYEAANMTTTADEPHYLVTMRSLVQDHDLDLRNQYDEGQYRDFYPEDLPDRHAVDIGGAQYPIHDVGLAFLGAVP